MPSIFEIKRHYGEMQTKLINESFELGASAQHFESEMSPELERTLGKQEADTVRAAEAAIAAEEERDRLRTRYEELDLELRGAVEVRLEEVQRLLSPKEAGFADFAAAASATPEALIASMDMALTAGDEDAALVAFAAGRQRDLEEVVAHAIDAREDWSNLYVELAEGAVDPELDPGDRFELFAQKAPTKAGIFNDRQSDRNLYGMLR